MQRKAKTRAMGNVQRRLAQAQSPLLPHAARSCERTSLLHFPQQVATPSSLRNALKVLAPCAMLAEIWRVVTAWQTQTYMEELQSIFGNTNYYQQTIQMQVILIFAHSASSVSLPAQTPKRYSPTLERKRTAFKQCSRRRRKRTRNRSGTKDRSQYRILWRAMARQAYLSGAHPPKGQAAGRVLFVSSRQLPISQVSRTEG